MDTPREKKSEEVARTAECFCQRVLVGGSPELKINLPGTAALGLVFWDRPGVKHVLKNDNIEQFSSGDFSLSLKLKSVKSNVGERCWRLRNNSRVLYGKKYRINTCKIVY